MQADVWIPTTMQQQQEVRARMHLFRVSSFLRPTWCVVCKGVILGFRKQGFKCEECGVNVHKNCQLQAHAIAPCHSLEGSAGVGGGVAGSGEGSARAIFSVFVVVVGATSAACSCARRVVSAFNSSWAAHTCAQSVEGADGRSTTACPAAS